MSKKEKVTFVRIEISFFKKVLHFAAREMRREVVELEGHRRENFIDENGFFDKEWLRCIALSMCGISQKEFEGYDYSSIKLEEKNYFYTEGDDKNISMYEDEGDEIIVSIPRR